MIKKDNLLIEAMEMAVTDRVDGIPAEKIVRNKHCTVSTVEIKTDEEQKILGKEKGRYVTVEFEKIYKIDEADFESVVSVVTDILKRYTDKYKNKRILIVGIGNREITADSIGPKTIDRIIVTRGLENTEFVGEGLFGNVSAICTDVFGNTGVESAEIVEGIGKTLSPSLIIVVDSLATVKLDRLCKTVQISDTSISPGGGIENERKTISSHRLGIPIVSIGVPTVIDTSLLVKESDERLDSLITIPSQIETATDLGAKLIAFSINKAIHYDLTTEDILKFLY